MRTCQKPCRPSVEGDIGVAFRGGSGGLVARSCESAAFSQSCQATRAVDDADDDQRIGLWAVIDGVRAVERHPQARRELFALGTGKREMAQRLEMCLDRRDKPCCDLFRSLCCQGRPDFGQISFGSFREAQG